MSGHRGVQQETPRPRAGARAARRFTLVPPADGRVVVPAEPPVELLGVSKIFSGDGPSAVYAVRGVDLVLPPGSATLVEGPSGSGKTTLLGLVACLVRPTAGRIRVGGVETTRLPEDRLAELRRRRFGFVFQAHHLIRGATALDNVVVPALPRPEVDGDLRPRAFALLGQLGLAARANERVERLSGGEQQRVAIARALINDPPVLLADEPTAHLDPEATGELLELLERLFCAGTALVVASHDPAICGSDLFDRRFELRGGRLRERSASWC